MEAMEAILTRRSVRRFTDKPIDDEAMNKILAAAMAGPSAVNARPWSFLVVRDQETLNNMADVNGRAAEPLRRCAAAVVVCGDMGRAFPQAPDYWVVDGAIAGQNICLGAWALGIGSVWLGTWPQKEKVEGQAALFGLPETQVPHSVIALGWPDEAPASRGGFEAERVHFERW